MGLFADLLAGRVPPHSEVTSTAARQRFGYLLELAALRSDPPLADRLAAEAELVRRQIAGATTAELPPIGLFGPARRGPCHDVIASRWGLTGGLDLARFETFQATQTPSPVVPGRRPAGEATVSS